MLSLSVRFKSNRLPDHHWTFNPPLLPPRFGLHTKGESTCFIVKRNSADEAAKAVRPVCISHKQTQDRSAKKSPSCSDLRGYREFAEPALVLTIAATGTIESGLKRHREMIGKEVLRPGTKRKPLAPAFSRIAALRSLVDEYRLDGKLVVWLNQ